MPSCSKAPRSAAGQAAPHLPCSAYIGAGCVSLQREGWLWVGPVSRELPQTGCAWPGVPGGDGDTGLALCSPVVLGWHQGCALQESACRAWHCPQRHFYRGLLCGWRSQRPGSSCCVTLCASVSPCPCPFLGAALCDARTVPTLGVMPCRHFPPSWDSPSPWRAVQNTCQHPES